MQKCDDSPMLSPIVKDTTYELGILLWILYGEVYYLDLKRYKVNGVKQDDFAKVHTFKKFVRDD